VIAFVNELKGLPTCQDENGCMHTYMDLHICEWAYAFYESLYQELIKSEGRGSM